MQFTTTLIAAAALCFGLTAAHPGHNVRAEAAARAEFLKTATRRDLSHCKNKLKARGLADAAVQRRAEKAKALRAAKGLDAAAPYLSRRGDHLSSENFTLSTPFDEIFTDNSTCVLQTETTQGPYYATGEYIRENITEGQSGIDLTVELQILDIDTCEPVENAMIDFWHCNSTGVYSGIVASGNGNTADTENLQKKFLRGLQETEDDGVATFQTIFPGHYTSRATHIHIMVHFNGTIEANGTYSGGTDAHVGQLFFDQDLITEVETYSPYSTNTQDLTTNADDSVLATEGVTTDPLLEYVLLGDDVSDGILAWISVAVDTSSDSQVKAAASCYADGCVEN